MPTAVCPRCGRLDPPEPCDCLAPSTDTVGVTLPSDAPAPDHNSTVAHVPAPPTLTLPPPEGLVETASADAFPTRTVPPPRTLGHFQVLDKLGEGAFGEVFRARDPKLARDVALKVAKAGALATPQQVARFLREARAAANLNHPNIVPLYETGEEGGRHFIAAAYVAGGTLARELGAAEGPLHPRRAADVVRRLADALAYAHRRGVVHRDVKPANVLVDRAGEPHLADFGLAVRLDDEGADRMTRDGEVMGTPGYMSPEQASGRLADVGPPTDQYALGIVLYELLAGRRPFIGDVITVLRQQVDAIPPRPRQFRPDVPPDLENVCLKCLEKEPRRRYPSCDELAEDLRRWLAGETVTVRRPGPVERTVRWARRSPFQAATAAALFLALVAGGFALSARVDRAEATLRQMAAEGELKERQLDAANKKQSDLAKAVGFFRRAENEAAKAEPDWPAVERDAVAAVQTAPPGPDGSLVRDPAQRLADRARGEVGGAREKSAARAKLKALADAHAEAAVFGSDYSGLDPAENAARLRAATGRGLALFRVAPDGNGPPDADPRFFTPADVALVADRCYELLLLEAQALGRTPDAAGALARLDRADRLLGADGPARSGLLRRAALFERTNNPNGAKAAREQAARTPPRLAADYYEEGLARYRRDEFRAAAEPLAQALRVSQDHYAAEYLLAVCRLRDGEYAAARDGFSRCLARLPSFAWPRLTRGFASLKLEQWGDALADFDAVLDAPPDAGAAYIARVNRGVLRLSRREWGRAEADFRAAIAAAPGDSAAYLNLAVCLRERDLPSPPWSDVVRLLAPGGIFAVAAREALAADGRHRAEAALSAGAKACPDVAALFHERGRTRLSLADFAGAKADFRRAVELARAGGANATLADDLIEWGRLLQRDGDAPGAARAYRLALEERPDRFAAWRLLGASLLAQKQYADAADALDRYLAAAAPLPGAPLTSERAATLAEGHRARGQLLDEEAAAYRARGLLHTREQNLRAALDAYTRGLALTRDAETLTLRGWTYLTLDAPTLALADFDEAVRRRPADADAKLGRANARAQLGRFAEALADADAASGGVATPRARFNAARVYALAAPWAMKERGDLDGFRRIAGRAVELLRGAVDRTPEAERAAFVRDYVRADRAFDAIRLFPPMAELISVSGRDAGDR